MLSFIRRLVGSDPRMLRAEKTHSERASALEQANKELDDLKERLGNLGQESLREGQALARTLEEISTSLRPENFPEVELSHGEPEKP